MSDLVRAASLNENGVSLFIFFVLFIYSLDVRREKIEVIIIIIIDQRMVVLVVLGLWTYSNSQICYMITVLYALFDDGLQRRVLALLESPL